MPQPGARPTRVRWVMFALIGAVSWLLYLQRYAWGVIKPSFLAENPDIDPTEVGWLDSLFLAAYAFGQVPGGLVGDFYGPRGALTVMILLWSLAGAGVVWVAGFWKIGAVRAAFGLAQAGAYPVVSKMTRTWFPLSVRTSVQGIVASLGRVGAACSSLVIASLLIGQLGLSWQSALLVTMAPGAALAVVCWLLIRDKPQDHPLVNAAELELIEERARNGPDSGIRSQEAEVRGQQSAVTGQHPGPGDAPTEHGRPSRGALFSLGMLLVYAFASTFQDQLYVFWIPLFLVQGRGLDATTMGLFTPLPLIGGAVGGIVGGFLNDLLIRTWGDRRWARSTIGCCGKGIAAGLVLLSLQMSDGRVAMVVLAAARFFGDWSLPTQWGAITDMGGRASATLFGLVNTVGALGGFAAGPCLGYLQQHYGWDGLFYGVVAMCIVASLTWLFIDCTKQVGRSQ